MPKRKKNTKKTQVVEEEQASLSSDGEPQTFDDDDESIDDDEAFNSEDERKYGAFFEKDDDDDDAQGGDSDDEELTSEEEDSEGDDDSDDDDDEEGDGGQYMLDLLNKLDAPDGSGKREKSEAMNQAAAATNVSESEYAASVLKKGNLTLDSLMEGLQDTKGFGVMQKSLRKIVEGETTQAPVAKVVSKRAERKVYYESQSKEVSQWLETVQQNRKAETLDFRNKERLGVTRENMVDKFVPTTDFEKAVHAALQEAGQEDEEAIMKAEEAAFMAQQDDLGENEQTMDEFKKRRGQLAKMRALMFYHEQKRHRMKKIKSKKYRRIRKKQRERAKESEIDAQAQDNPDILRELEEKEEFDRMKERMTLAHKNTSKWAKRILRRGKNVDVDTRKALSAQLKRGDDLRKKMNQAGYGSDSDDSGSEDLVESARKVLQDTETTNEEASERSGLFNLKFMQKGMEKQREQAKEEARQLLRELEANEKLDDYDEAVMDDDSEDGDGNTPVKKPDVASKESMKQLLNEGEMVASSLKFGRSDVVSVSGGINIDMGAAANASAISGSQHTATLAVENDGKPLTKAEKRKLKKQKKKEKRREPMAAPEVSEEANPWISPAQDTLVGVESKSSKKRKSASALKTGMVDVERVLDVLTDGVQQAETKKVSPASDNKEEPKSITHLSQEELVRRAFATAPDKEADDGFATEKAEVEDEENDTKTASQRKKQKDMDVVSGWGSWAGDGAPAPRLPHKLPKHLQPPKKKETKRKREDAKRPNVIIREKRVKKTANTFMLEKVPYPYTSREEYERAMMGAVGKEWNVTKSVKDLTRPEIQARSGTMIQPLSSKVKKPQRGPAKF